MNFEVTYKSPEGFEFKKKTYTYLEAREIVKNSCFNGCVEFSIEALNEPSKLEMYTFDNLQTFVDKICAHLPVGYVKKGEKKYDK